MTGFRALCEEAVAATRAAPPGRTPSLIATLFGDVVEAHGGEIWLGSLVRLMAPLGVGERLVRTAVSRLARDGFLSGTRSGRRSFYRVSDHARPKVERLERRIYHADAPPWNGDWHLVFTGTLGIEPSRRAELRRRLVWLGFGVVAPNVYGHPTAPLEPVWQLLEEMGVADQAVVMRAAKIDRSRGLSEREMAAQCFRLEGVAQGYRDFIAAFTPLADALAATGSRGGHPEHCFVLRVRLIHAYRRVVLKDPTLPRALLPDAWPGHEAQRLCAALHRGLQPAAETFIRGVAEDRAGPYGPVTPGHAGRFRHLDG